MPRPIAPDDFPWFDYGRYSFSLGLELDGWALLSGHSASRYDPGADRIVVEGGMADQARTAYAKIERILGAAGLGWEHVVHLVENVTTTGIDHYQEAERVRAELFGAQTPAVSTVVVNGLLRPAAWIEVEVTAARDPGVAFAVESAGRAAFAPARRADGIVHLSTVHPYNDVGELVGEGDLVAQTTQIFRNAARTLAACGLDLSNVVKTLEMVHPDGLADYKETSRVRREHLGPVYPAAAGIIQHRVAGDDRILISYDFIASAHEQRAVNPGWERYRKLTYSPAVLAGPVLFMSGQAALDPATERAVLPGDVAAQADYTYRNITSVLEAADLGPEHLVRTVEYVTPEGLDGYRAVADVRKNLLRPPWPASTGLGCAALLRPEFLIEIDPLAFVGG